MSLQKLQRQQIYKQRIPSCIFFTELDKENTIDKDLNLKDIHQKIAKITQQLKYFQQNDIKEWAEIQYNKISQLEGSLVKNNRTKIISKSLRESLRIMIFVCSNLNIEFDMTKIEKSIKRVYSKEYQFKDIQQYFVKAGIQIKELNVLEYRPNKNWLRCLCCCASE